MEVSEVDIETLQRETSSGKLSGDDLIFVVDIGASNTRLGLAPLRSSRLYIKFVKFPVNGIPELLQAFGHFEKVLGRSVTKRIVSAALNLPGPVQGSVGGPIANFKGATPQEKTLKMSMLPQSLFPVHHTMMLNDLEAGAYGVIAAHQYRMFGHFFAPMWKGTAQTEVPTSLAGGHCLVVAPGTGLGVALIQYHSFSGQYTVMPLEFGHTSVQSETDTEFLGQYKKALNRGNYAAEYDDLCSGRGLERFYSFVSNGKVKSAKEISELAKTNDPEAAKALKLYKKFLMRFCSQMAMGFVPHMIVLCGDNIVHNAFMFEDSAASDEMKATMLDHSAERMGFMSRPSMLRQCQSTNFNLLGCVHAGELASRVESKL